MIHPDTGEIVDHPFTMLDPYAEDGTVISTPRQSWIASISAGELVPNRDPNRPPIPQASRDGRIFLHDAEGRAPKLAEVLAAAGGKKLTIVFPYDDLESFVHQRFTRRSAAALEVYGDQYTLTQIRDGHHLTYSVGSSEYRELKSTCRAEVSVLFALGEWLVTPQGVRSQVSFPDGFGWYRLRFTSRHSLQSIVGKLQEVKERVTGGRLAGLPFELSITYRDVADGSGKTRHIPVWTLAFKPPQEIRLTSGNLGGILRGALEEGARLRLLPGPVPETYALAALDPALPDLDEGLVEVLTNPEVPADVRAWEQRWFALVRGTFLDSDETRADFLREVTSGHFDSLADFLATATEGAAAGLVTAAAHAIERWRVEQRERAPAPEPEPFFTRPMEPADVVDLDPEPEAAPTPDDPHVTSTRDPAWTAWLALTQEAGRVGVEAPLLTPPTAAPRRISELRDEYARLQQAIKDKTGATPQR